MTCVDEHFASAACMGARNFVLLLTSGSMNNRATPRRGDLFRLDSFDGYNDEIDNACKSGQYRLESS